MSQRLGALRVGDVLAIPEEKFVDLGGPDIDVLPGGRSDPSTS